MTEVLTVDELAAMLKMSKGQIYRDDEGSRQVPDATTAMLQDSESFVGMVHPSPIG